MSRTPFDEISERLGRLLPEGAQEMRDDFERNARSVLQQALSRMDLVTREELDVQSEVLARTRAQLEAMEARVAELERQAGIQPPAQGDESPADPE
ncbi:MAG: accessory factor UbiK family protein [Halofilum sp. (in: g-proteobacteria)]|nr:accessory factor UbiK family protein [Halofilum sp. (in: g-proteobacteria)]